MTISREELVRQLTELRETVDFNKQLCVIETGCGMFQSFQEFKDIYVNPDRGLVSVFLNEDEDEYIDINLKDEDNYMLYSEIKRDDLIAGDQKQIDYTIQGEFGVGIIVLRFNVLS